MLKLWCEQSTSVISQPRLSLPAGSRPFAHKNTLSGVKTLVRAKGLEPSTSTLARLRSSQLSYARTSCDYNDIVFIQMQVLFLKFYTKANHGIYIHQFLGTEPITTLFFTLGCGRIGQLPFYLGHIHST